jgi:spore maturation protein SpmA
MLNYIWLAFLLIAVLVGGFTGKLPEMTKGAFETAETAVMKIALPLVGVMAIWLGVMRLAERSGLVQVLARALRPLMIRLFPDVPAEHPAMGAMLMNMAANMLGLGNAATPLGLRAMSLLDKLNPRPGVASNAMCTFLAINTASIQLVPTTAIGLLAIAGSKNATAIVPAAFLATCIAACSGVLSAKLLERLPMFRLPAGAPPPRETESLERKEEEVAVEQMAARPLTRDGRFFLILFTICFVVMFVMLAFPDAVNAGLIWLQTNGKSAPRLDSIWLVPPLSAEMASRGPVIRSLFAVSIVAVPFLLSFFPLYAALRGVKVYEQFVEGAKEAFGVGQRIIPFLVAMLVAIRLLREAGVIDLMTKGLTPLFAAIHFPADLLPLVLMRPLSGSATQGLFVELINRLGPDTLVSRMAATIYGSTETTFYVIAVYFGSVAVRQTRHAIAAGLIADSVAVIASITICRLLFA